MVGKTNGSQLWDSKAAGLAGGVCMAVSALAAAALVAWVVPNRAQPIEATLCQMAIAVLLALTGVASVQMLRGRQWAHEALMGFWLSLGVLLACGGVAAMLWGEPPQWNSLSPVPLNWVLLMGLPLSIAVIALLVRTTAPSTRLRYGAMVYVSVAAAAALVIVANLIAHRDPVRKDVEMLGRYGLSQRTLRILEPINNPVRLTILYTGSEPNRRGEDYRRDVVEVAEEIRQAVLKRGGAMDVVNVTSEAQRAETLTRLQAELSGQHPEHMKVLEQAADLGPKLQRLREEVKQPWKNLSEDSYLGLWGAADMSLRLDQVTGELTQVTNKISQQISGTGVPDIGALVDELRETLGQIQKDLEGTAAFIAKIAGIPAAVQSNRDSAAKAMAAAGKSLEAMSASVAKDASGDPKAALTAFAEATDKARTAILAASDQLRNLAGKDNANVLAQIPLWSFVISDPQTAQRKRTTMAGVWRQWAEVQMAGWADDARQAVRTLNAQGQAEMVASLRSDMADVQAVFKQTQAQASESMARLTTLSKEDQAIFDQARQGKLFEAILQPVAELLLKVGTLGPVGKTTLSEDLRSDNVVLVELAGKTEVVSFDDVWPLKASPRMGEAVAEASNKRIFNGESAVASRLLAMAQKRPFATVLLCYAAAPMPPQMPSMAEGLAPWDTLAKRLREANFDVKEWNLNDPMPPEEPLDSPAATGQARPSRVLMILPEAPYAKVSPYGPPRSEFTPQHADKIRRLIDAGTPALWLMNFSLSGPTSVDVNPLADYFADDWGIMTQRDHLAICAVADQTQAGKFRLDMNRFFWLPLNTFADQPVGASLRSQRVLWRFLCPITRGDVRKGRDNKPLRLVDYQPILSIPASWKGAWAASPASVRRISQSLFVTGADDFIAPDLAAGDVLAPFDVAAAATCSKGQNVEPTRVVALAMALSLQDDYLTMRSQTSEGHMAEPPRANADLVVNSVYWLIGREAFIAAGPPQIQPIEMISQARWNVLFGICVLGLPALVVAAGLIVSAIRRSS